MQTFIPSIASAVAWICSWILDQQLTFLHYATGISVVFFPSGIRTLAVFLFGFRGAIGIFAGNLITAAAYFAGERQIGIGSIVAISMVSAFSAYIVMEIVCRWKSIPDDLSNLKFKGVTYIVVSQGLLSATLHKIVFYLENINDLQQAGESVIIANWLAMALGDITGSMIVLTSVWAVFNQLDKTRA